VTAIDLAVQSYILAELKQRTPDFAVMAEESDVNQTSFAKPTWILDPVDGTTNLMRDYRHSAISLALAEEGRVTLGSSSTPMPRVSSPRSRRFLLERERIRTSSVHRLQTAWVGFCTTPYEPHAGAYDFQWSNRSLCAPSRCAAPARRSLDLAYIPAADRRFLRADLQPWD
jgi:myo-inositol-1(or 4)-monophosphatase